jgi:tetratricopeptide (TPR) repeat protein
MADRAIADYDGVLRLDPSHADIHNARGELWRKKGDLPKAVADFAAAIKLNPDHVAARANHRALAQELERLGALKAMAGKPSFNCATARRKVEKAICANPELADLDREVHGSYVRAAAQKMTPRQARALRREQEEYIARRNSEYGRPGYDLKKAMRDRLQQINGIDGY